ncbi:hypothetical protein RRG08_010706 [Elysia crispata]|uniref:Uncharacterized protein n=1 Tax=Elysia crispata TaxID=231223 RepID=A0AAE1E7N5_9GAST|nr:hypothetical protein RRG08_010706 [Elysia crispata]
MNSSKTYLDFPDYVKKMDSTHNRWSEDDFDLLSATAEWLANQKDVNKLIQKGIDNAAEWKQHHKDEKVAVQEKVKQRILENKEKNDEKKIKSSLKHLAALDAMFDIPLATTKEELDSIFNGPKATERMKDQIRYRSVVLHEKITMKGSKKELYDKLLAQILLLQHHSSSHDDSSSSISD